MNASWPATTLRRCRGTTLIWTLRICGLRSRSCLRWL